MKIAIKVLTEWDRLNVIAFFEKHYPNCNDSWRVEDVKLAEIWYINKYKNLTYLPYFNNEDLSKYTILERVPVDMELPKVETTPTREQDLEDCLEEFVKDYLFEKGSDFHHPTIEKAINLLNQK